MRINIDVVMSDTLLPRIEHVTGKVIENLNLTGNFAKRKIAEGTPVDTGRLQNSWDIEEATQENPIVEISTNVEYAEAIEYGSPDMPLNDDLTYTVKSSNPPKYNAGDKRPRAMVRQAIPPTQAYATSLGMLE